MDRDYFKGKKVTVLGLGLHGGGIGIVKFLVSCGAKVVVTDLKTKDELAGSLAKLEGLKGVEFVLGAHRTEDFSNADMVIKNPVVRWDSPHVKIALEKKIPVEMDSSLFFKMCPNPIIGVTGTKGKTTTSLAIAEILKGAGRDVVKAGIGQVSVLDKLSALKKDSVVVFELSSWRLSALGRAKMSPRIAVITNLLRDHLNYYKDMAEYAADKKPIFLYQKPHDWLIINADDPTVKGMAAEAKGQVLEYSYASIKNDQTIFLDQEAIFWNNGIDTKRIIDIQNLKIRGRHNLGNLMAAAGACLAFGLTAEEVAEGLRQFKGAPHRLEFVREFGGVQYYNDTAATIPDATIQALSSFTEPLVLIAGGNDKNLQFAELAKMIIEKTKAAVFIKGIGTDKILSEIQKITGLPNQRYKIASSMEEAVREARSLAQPGDVVLLSPGTSSFGVFLNEFDRGDKFKQAVEELG